MTKDELLSLLSEVPTVDRVAAALKDEGAKLRIKGLAGSAIAFVAANVVKQTDRHHLFILSDREEAAYFLSDLELLMGKKRVLFFPMSYRRPYEQEQADNSNVIQRGEVLNALQTGSGHQLVVTYPQALAEKVSSRKVLKKNTLQVHVGEQLSLDFLNEMLHEYHFERVDQVYGPGQFAIRGGIVDVFSFAQELPYRIELFGNDVESIRSFDPAEQLSVRSLRKAVIVPHVQDGMMLEETVPFLDFLPARSVVWVRDAESVTLRVEQELTAAREAFSQLQSTVRQLPPESRYASAEETVRALEAATVVEFGQRRFFNRAEEFPFDMAPQPQVAKDFKVLQRILIDNRKAGYTNVMLVDNPGQIKRLEEIFENLPTPPPTPPPRGGERPARNAGSLDLDGMPQDVDSPSLGGGRGEVLKGQGEVFSLPLGEGQGGVFTPMLLSVHEGFIDHTAKLACFTDHQIFERYHRFKVRSGYKRGKEAFTLKELSGLTPGDYVTHVDHGVGKFAGLEKIEVNGKVQEAIRLVYRDNDIVYVSIHSLHRIAKYSGKEGAEPKIDKIGSPAWKNLKAKTKSRVKDIAKDLIQLYARRKAQKGFAFHPDTYLQAELEASFIYEDTPDQETATIAVKADMERDWPMDRLVCGDVGFGKTEIAIRAAFKAVADGKQVAVLVPTTILALQHARTFRERLKDFPCTVDYINRFKTAKQQSDTLKRLAEGKVDILIGTHRIVGKDVKFKDLGLLVIDEEQKFGVAVKDKLKEMKANVDTLTLTATPIPRTLQFSLMGARDLSVLSTPPPNRHPVITELHGFNEEFIRDAVMYEVGRGGQVFFVNNRVENIREVAGVISRVCPDVRVCIGHGQLDPVQMEDIMMRFIEGEYDVLVATTIIESGLDIPNANTIIINNAHNFGLSDLHQMRGRVGRSNRKAFCYLLTPPLSALTADARRRMVAITEFSELGSGMNIAMRDLDIRGAGNLLGAEQSGFITDIGYEMYQRILDEAVQELKETEFKELFADQPQRPAVSDCQIDTDLEILLPDSYVNSIAERLALYRELDDTRREQDLQRFEAKVRDRFGPLPEPAQQLLHTVRLRWLAQAIGFEKLFLKQGRLSCHFVADPQSSYYQGDAFTHVLQYVQTHPRACAMKQKGEKLTLTFENVSSVKEAWERLKPLAVEMPEEGEVVNEVLEEGEV